MSSSSRSSSTFAQLRSSAAMRLTEGLLSSGGKVAGVGLAMALLTLGFTIWFRIELGYQAEIGGPLARAASVLDASINESLASLRGWVAYGDPIFAAERRRVWEQQIEPSVVRLAELADASRQVEAAERVDALEHSLRELARIQWAIEDVARTPGNLPASVAYSMRLEPLRHSLLAGIGDAIQRYTEENRERGSVEFLALLARFRSTFIEGDLALNELLVDYSGAREHDVKERLARSRELASRIAKAAQRETRGDLLQLIDFSIQEFGAYTIQVEEIIALRLSPSRNVAERLFVEEANPTATQALAISGELAAEQTRLAAQKAQSLAEASYAVIAMALVMGLLSAGSLWVSFRLRQQVENVMERAKKLGQYVLDKRLGKGAMGEVYLAHHAMLRRPTAIKLLRPESAQDLRAQRRFQTEVQSTSQLTHPNTIEIFDYGRTPEGVFYYAMEFLDGFTLQSLVSLAGPVDPARVASIIVQACGSLHEAHSRGLVHRDIKPTNLMLTERGGVYDVVKILDFGLVKDLAAGTSSSDHDGVDAIVGTPMYLAPESILSSAGGMPQADLYALGAVAYFLLTATTVFPTGTTMEILDRHLHEDPEFPSQRLAREMPRDLEYVVMACLAKDPADRPASAQHLAEMVEACEVGSWTAADARAWWDEYGEAARNEVVVEEASSSLRSGPEVVVAATRE